ncbi:MAG: hypothetical protein AAF358_17030 [Pseudomonadota bacterium]
MRSLFFAVAALMGASDITPLGIADEVFLSGFEADDPGVDSGSITMRSDSIRTYEHLDFLYAWHETQVQMYGDRPRLVEADTNPRVPASQTTFTGGLEGDTFGFRLSGVADWDSDAALAALENGSFETYVESRLSGDDGIRIDRHADFSGLKLGFGVDSSAVQTDSGDSINRTDRVSQPGEALVLVIDTDGTYQPDENLPGNTHYEFVPNGFTFANNGLNQQTQLVLENLHLEPVNVNPRNISCTVDYFVYDISEQAVIAGRTGAPGYTIGLPLTSLNNIGTLPGSWEMEDGDIIVIAYNKDTALFGSDGRSLKHSWGLWSLKWDLIER